MSKSLTSSNQESSLLSPLPLWMTSPSTSDSGALIRSHQLRIFCLFACQITCLPSSSLLPFSYRWRGVFLHPRRPPQPCTQALVPTLLPSWNLGLIIVPPSPVSSASPILEYSLNHISSMLTSFSLQKKKRWVSGENNVITSFSFCQVRTLRLLSASHHHLFNFLK